MSDSASTRQSVDSQICGRPPSARIRDGAHSFEEGQPLTPVVLPGLTGAADDDCRLCPGKYRELLGIPLRRLTLRRDPRGIRHHLVRRVRGGGIGGPQYEQISAIAPCHIGDFPDRQGALRSVQSSPAVNDDLLVGTNDPRYPELFL